MHTDGRTLALLPGRELGRRLCHAVTQHARAVRCLLARQPGRPLPARLRPAFLPAARALLLVRLAARKRRGALGLGQRHGRPPPGRRLDMGLVLGGGRPLPRLGLPRRSQPHGWERARLHSAVVELPCETPELARKSGISAIADCPGQHRLHWRLHNHHLWCTRRPARRCSSALLFDAACNGAARNGAARRRMGEEGRSTTALTLPPPWTLLHRVEQLLRAQLDDLEGVEDIQALAGRHTAGTAARAGSTARGASPRHAPQARHGLNRDRYALVAARGVLASSSKSGAHARTEPCSSKRPN
eukprot:scaffold129087_cov66-Phaeocystis_antarctica.AAC.1